MNNIIFICVLLVLSISFLFISDSTINLNKYEIKECKNTIFEYDVVECYNLKINEFNNILDKKDTIKRKLLNDYFTNINDSINLKYIERYYKRKKLSLKSLKFLKSYICKNKVNLNNEFSECLPVFRDIIIFKRQSKIVGINKICFECNLSNIVSTEYNSDMLKEEELQVLEKFLRE